MKGRILNVSDTAEPSLRETASGLAAGTSNSVGARYSVKEYIASHSQSSIDTALVWKSTGVFLRLLLCQQQLDGWTTGRER